jgi:antirestriction protein ArdC
MERYKRKSGQQLPDIRDRYQEITDRFIAAIEAGADKRWEMPWHKVYAAGMPYNEVTGREYNGVNVMLLAMAAASLNYASNAWASYQQWASKGGQVRKGEHGQMICYFGAMQVDGPSSTIGEEEQRTIRFLKFSTVFNHAQVENAPELKQHGPAPLAERLEHAEQFVQGTGAVIHYGRHKACYVPALDAVRMPDRANFKKTKDASATENFYATLNHELVHWSGGSKRLDRLPKLIRHGDEQYAMEELVAEIGATYVNARLGLRETPSPNNIAYVQSWLKRLREELQ